MKYGAPVQLRVTAVFGGVSMVPQVKALTRGADIVVATPGRLIDHLQRRTIDLSAIEILVLDEADRMLDMRTNAVEQLTERRTRARVRGQAHERLADGTISLLLVMTDEQYSGRHDALPLVLKRIFRCESAFERGES